LGELTKKYTHTYTNNALIYQSILKYSITFGTSHFFRTRSILIEWLLKHCPVYDEKYKVKDKTTFRNRAESLSPTITQYLDNLRYLGLLESKRVIAANKEETSEYRFTELARLIAIVIIYSEPNLEKQKTSINEVYDQILRYYDAERYSHARFCSIFFRNCYDYNKDLFKLIISNFYKIIKKASDDKNAFVTQLRKFQVFHNNPLMWQIFKQSLEDLENQYVDNHKIFLYGLKLEMEEIHELKSRNRSGFEQMRMRARGDPNLLVLEGYCKKCKIYASVVVDLLDYFEAYVVNPNKQTRAPCPLCGIDGGLNFETLE
jgi:hypothetical protein